MGFDEQTFEKLLKSCRYRNVPSTPPESQTNGSLDSLEAMMALSKSGISFSNGWFSGSCIIEEYIVALAWVLPPRIVSLQLKVRKGKFEHQEAFLVVPAFLASANFSRFFWSPNTQHSEVWQIPSKNSGEDWRSTKALRLTEIRKTRLKKRMSFAWTQNQNISKPFKTTLADLILPSNWRATSPSGLAIGHQWRVHKRLSKDPWSASWLPPNSWAVVQQQIATFDNRNGRIKLERKTFLSSWWNRLGG